MLDSLQQRHGLKAWQRRVSILLLVLVVAVVALGAYLSRRISRLESAVRERKEFGDLEGSEHFLQVVVSSRIFPGFLRGRASGLLGDLAYHHKKPKTALDYYGQSMGRLKGSDLANPLHFVPAALEGPGDFHRGFRDHSVSSPPPLALDDADLELPIAAKTDDEAWAALNAIRVMEDADAREVWDWIKGANGTPAASSRRDELLAKYHEQIQALRRFTEPLTPPDPDDFSSLPKLSGFAGLMMLDALQQTERGSGDDAMQSFEAAYALLACFEQNPRLLTLLRAVSAHSHLADLLETEAGSGLRKLFRQKHCLGNSIWTLFPLGEYQATKRLTALTMPATDPRAVRLRGRVMAKQAAFWRGFCQQRGSMPDSDISEIMAGYLFKNRQFFQDPSTASFADGQRVAEEFEDCVAEIVHRVAVLNMGSLDKDLASLRAREAALARGQSE